MRDTFFNLRFVKALQAAAIVLRTEADEKMNYMKLLKLLYIADREAIAETGHSITGDQPVAMERGPLLSGIYDLICGQHVRAGRWADFIETLGYHVRLSEDPGRRHLSEYEIAKLQEVATRHNNDDEWAMVQFTHDNLDEWKWNEPGKSSKPISLHDILRATGTEKHEKSIRADAEHSDAFDRMLANLQS